MSRLPVNGYSDTAPTNHGTVPTVNSRSMPNYFLEQDHAEAYARFRPRYPEVLYAFLLEHTSGRDAAWDVGTGNGQVAIELSRHFGWVWATDSSEAQISVATTAPNVQYRVADASDSGIAAQAVDLITVGQAIHWFDLPSFYAEVRRVAKPGAFLAAWVYGVARFAQPLDDYVQALYNQTLADCWDTRRQLIDQGLSTLDFPFDQRKAPLLSLETEFSLEGLLGYLNTWSAVRTFRKRFGADPLSEWIPLLREAMGSTGKSMGSAPLHIRAGYVRG